MRDEVLTRHAIGTEAAGAECDVVSDRDSFGVMLASYVIGCATSMDAVLEGAAEGMLHA